MTGVLHPVAVTRPPTPALRTDVRFVPGGCEIHLEGELDVATAPQLEAAQHAVLECPPSVVLDVGRLTFCDARGVSAVLRMTKALQSRGHAVSLRGPRPAFLRVLHLCEVPERWLPVSFDPS